MSLLPWPLDQGSRPWKASFLFVFWCARQICEEFLIHECSFRARHLNGEINRLHQALSGIRIVCWKGLDRTMLYYKNICAKLDCLVDWYNYSRCQILCLAHSESVLFKGAYQNLHCLVIFIWHKLHKKNWRKWQLEAGRDLNWRPTDVKSHCAPPSPPHCPQIYLLRLI